MELANGTVHEAFTDETIDEGSPTPCDKVTLKQYLEHIKCLLAK